MKIQISILSLLSALISTGVFADSRSDTQLLPKNFPVYTNGTAVINHPYPGYQEKKLPTNNEYTANPGCYVACYSHDASTGIYSVGDDIYVNGQIRVAGKYVGRICKPTGYENADISAEDNFKSLCEKITSCANKQCWAGGDTGGWFGIQLNQ